MWLFFSICLLMAMLFLWGVAWGLTLVVSLLLIGRPTMIMEPPDVLGVLACVLGSLLTLIFAIKAEDKPNVCPRCGRVSWGDGTH